MPTGFDKFAQKLSSEQGIVINPSPKAGSSETRQVEKLAEAVGVHQPKRGRGRPRLEEPEEGMYNFSTQIRQETKNKLDELKFRFKLNYKQLAEEAFIDLYEKYKQQ